MRFQAEKVLFVKSLRIENFQLKFRDLRSVQRCVQSVVHLGESVQMSIYYLLLVFSFNIGVDTAENEPPEVSIFNTTQAIKFHTCIPPGENRETVLSVLSRRPAAAVAPSGLSELHPCLSSLGASQSVFSCLYWGFAEMYLF